MMIHAALVIACATALGPVVLRGGGVVLEEPVAAVGSEGVSVAGDSGRMIGWGEVREVTGEFAPAARAFAPASDRLWRAGQRLARGDVAIASPLFEALLKSHPLGTGPTSLAIAEGVLRCRLAQGRFAEAVEPWLVVLQARRAMARPSTTGAIRPLIDERTGLVPALPPLPMGPPHERAGAARSLLAREWPDPLVRELARVYADAFRGPEAAGDSPSSSSAPVKSAGDPPSSAPALAPVSTELGHEGLLVARAVARVARAQDEPESLEKLIRADGAPWAEAWAALAVALQQLSAPDRAARTDSVLRALSIAAQGDEQPDSLVHLALTAARAELTRQGDTRAVAVLGSDLQRIEQRWAAHAVHPRLAPSPTTPERPAE